MNVADKATFVMSTLDRLYPDPPIPLSHHDAYTLLVAVLLSAQCTDERVNQVTPLLWAHADGPMKMVQLGIARIAEIIKPCGLSNNKAKAIHRLSQILIDKHGGQVPDDMEALEQLPGVGHKTASVVMIQAYGHPAFPVDTHIHRLAMRWGLSSGKNVEETEADLKKIFPIDTWIKLHLQIIYFGREYCKARGHVPLECPICRVLGCMPT